MIKREASQPALSPGGERIAFRSWRSDDRGIEVMNATGGGEQRLSKFFEDALPSWSPDGLKLVFFSRRESDRKSRIYQVEALGGDDWELKRGVEPVWGEYPTWHPSGSIVYRSTWPDHGLAVMNADGSDGRMLLSEDSATAPAVSPDGRFIALMSQQDGNWEIYRINADGSGLLRLTDHEANDGLPTWSPDGSTIAFVSDRGGTWAIWAVAANGGGLSQLFTMPGPPNGLVDEQDFRSRGWVEERISWGP
jgi:TolB protein